MKTVNARTFTGRRARRALDRARNPEAVSAHACLRLMEDAHKDPTLGPVLDLRTADECIRRLCRHAKKIYRGRDTLIINAPPWFLFYRDRTVVTVLHHAATRLWLSSKEEATPPC